MSTDQRSVEALELGIWNQIPQNLLCQSSQKYTKMTEFLPTPSCIPGV